MLALFSRFRIITRSKIALVFIIGLLIIITGIFIWAHARSPMSEQALAWHPYVRDENAVLGYLYVLTNPAEGVSVYTSVDRKPDTNSYTLASGWIISYVSNEETWNPRVCAQMPTLIDAEGNLLMIDTQRSGVGKYISNLVILDRKTSSIKEADISSLHFRGFLFTDLQRRPFFFSIEGSALYTYTLTGQTLQKKLVKSFPPKTSITIAREYTGSPIIQIYNEKTFESNNYLFTDNALTSVNIKTLKVGNEQFLDGNHSRYNLGADVEAFYTLDNPYGTRVLFQGKQILKFNTLAQVYSFVVGAYKI